MTWSHFIRGHERTRATTVGVAGSLAQTIVESTNVLLERLRAEGFGWQDPTRAGADECLLECMIFEWFLRDVEIEHGFGGKAESIRRALAGRILVELQRSGLSPASCHDFTERYLDRFVEYREALGASLSLQPLGSAVWRRISGGSRPSERMTMLLALRATAELASLRGLAAAYRVVAVAPSPRPPGLGS